MGGRRGRRISLEDRTYALKRVSEVRQSGCKLETACSVLELSPRTLMRWKSCNSGDKRRGPLLSPRHKLSLEEKAKIVEIAVSPEFRDKPVAQIVPALADKGVYVASESSFHRVLKEHKLNAHRGRSKPPQKRKTPTPLVATMPNQIYSWDITYLKTSVAGRFFYLYCFMDIYSRKIVGYRVYDAENSENAAKLLKSICTQEQIKPGQVTLHSDNGSPMKGATMLATLQKLGVMPSFSRPAVSNDNPYSESLFKTTKYCHFYPSKPFESVDAAMSWVARFSHWYNEEHLHSGIRYVTPGSKHRGEDVAILEKRKAVYQAAKERKPERWSNKTREWSCITEVLLNPLKEKTNLDKQMAA